MAPILALLVCLAANESVAGEGSVAKTPVPVRVVVLAWEKEPGRAVVDHLTAEIPNMLTETATRAMAAEDVLARSTAREAVILLELSVARITAVRPDQQTVITRVFASNTGFQAPYSFAVATLELIDIAAERRPLPPPLPPPTPASWGFGVLAGPAFSAGLGSDPSLFQLGVGLDLVLRNAGRGAWWALGPRGRLLGRSSREAVIGPERFELSYQRNELSLRSSVGLSFGAVDLGLSANAGFSMASSEATTSSGAVRANQSARTAFLGPGLEARYALGAGFGIGLSVDVLVALEPVQYLVRDEVVLEEGRVRTLVSLVLGWQYEDEL